MVLLYAGSTVKCLSVHELCPAGRVMRVILWQKIFAQRKIAFVTWCFRDKSDFSIRTISIGIIIGMYYFLLCFYFKNSEIKITCHSR